MFKKAIFVLLLVFSLVTFNIDVVDAEIITMPTSKYDSLRLKEFNLSNKTLNYDKIDVNHEKLQMKTISGVDGFVITDTSNTARTYTADMQSNKPYLLRLYFDRIGSIAGKYVDLVFDVTEIELSTRWSESYVNSNVGVGVICVDDDHLGIGSYGCIGTWRYSADEYVTVKIKVVWSDTKQLVELPFITAQIDLDTHHNTNKNKTYEKWKQLSGYSDTYYVYNGTYLKNDAADGSGWWHTSKLDNTVDGKDSYLKTGIFSTTINGEFGSKYQEGLCATKVIVSSQFPSTDDDLMPVKQSKVLDSDGEEKSIVDSVSDKIQYTITQKLGNFEVDTFDAYSSLSIYDTIPEGLSYVSASVNMKEGNNNIDITNNSTYGSLSYDSDLRRVKYTFNSEWILNASNYTGQVVTLTINTNVVNAKEKYVDKAISNFSGIEFNSNIVEDNCDKLTPNYSYQSITSGKELPDDINASRGLYKITDNNSYLIGEDVTRNNSIPVNTNYVVYNEVYAMIGEWVLRSWDKDSAIMPSSNVEFIGYWEYVEYEEPKYRPRYTYQSITEGIDLPDEISTSYGDYQVGDNGEYNLDDSITRNNQIKIGTTYEVKDDDGNVIGIWELKSWNKDSLIVNTSSNEFVGYWEYRVVEVPVIDNPQTGTNYIFVLSALFILSIYGILLMKSSLFR